MTTPRPAIVRTSPEGLAFTSYLRIVAIVAVVLIHSLAPIVGNDAIRHSRTWWVGTALDIGVAWAVPAFVMVSGALLLAPSTESIGAFYRRRLARIGIPLVFAHVGYLVLRGTVMGQDLRLEQVTIELVEARVFTHLYFFWIVIGLYAITPLLRNFVEGSGEVAALRAGLAAIGWMVTVTVVAALLARLGQPITIWRPGALTMFVPYIGYFLLGYAIRDRVLTGLPLALAVVGLATGATLAILAYALDLGPILEVALGGNYLGIPVALTTVCVYLVGRALLDRAGVLGSAALSARVRGVAELAFGVFIVHYAVLVGMRLWVPELSFAAVGDSVPLALVQWAVATAISFGIAAAMSRIPGVRRLIGLSGGRGAAR